MVRQLFNRTKMKKNIQSVEKPVIMVVKLFSIAVLILAITYIINYVPIPKDIITGNIVSYTYSNPVYRYEVTRFPTNGSVTQIEKDSEKLGIGVVVDDWNLNFGYVPAGGSSSRFLDMTNFGQKSAKITFVTPKNQDFSKKVRKDGKCDNKGNFRIQGGKCRRVCRGDRQNS